MTEDNPFYVGVDVSKAKHARAAGEGGRDGEVRYIGEIEATMGRRWSVACESWRLERKHPRLHFCLYEEGQDGRGVCGIHDLSPDIMTRLVYPSQIHRIYGRC